MIALGVGLPVAGAVVLLFVQAAFEQRRGLADTTVEENAYVLQSRITSCLRSMSASGGLTGVGSSAVYDASHSVIIGYQTVYGFQANPTNSGSYTTEQISFNPSSGQVLYTPNMAASSNQIVWMKTNSPTLALRQLYLIAHFDGSQNSSLVDVHFEMDDNGYSQQGTNNNLADIDRSFFVQMRSD
jgi:hypothetical protein